MDQPPVNLEAMRAIAAAVRTHGGADNVPEDVLAQYEYGRREDGTLTPLGRLAADAVASEELRQKAERMPFAPFEIEVGAGSSYRNLSETLRQSIYDAEAAVDHLAGDVRHEILTLEEIMGFEMNAALTGVHDRLQNERRTLLSLPAEYWTDPQKADVLTELADLIACPLIGITPISFDNKHRYGELTATIDAELERSMASPTPPLNVESVLLPTQISQKLAIQAERKRGVVADASRIYEAYDKHYGFDQQLGDADSETTFVLTVYCQENNIPEEYPTNLLAELKKMGVQSYGQALAWMCGQLLDLQVPAEPELGFSAALVKATSTAEAYQIIQSIIEQRGHINSRALREAKANLKNTPFGHANRGQAEATVTSAKAAQRQLVAASAPFLRVFGAPKHYLDLLNKQFDTIQNTLTTTGSTARRFKLDPTPDPSRDVRTYEVSGDCTEDNPLPFMDPANNLYNVKVLEADDHVGNIYLMQVADPSGKITAWHINAVQIPRYLDWDKAAQALMTGLSAQARAAGVSMIVLNQTAHHISNYDYISEAILGLPHGKLAQKPAEILRKKATKLKLQGAPDEGFIVFKTSSSE